MLFALRPSQPVPVIVTGYWIRGMSGSMPGFGIAFGRGPIWREDCIDLCRIGGDGVQVHDCGHRTDGVELCELCIGCRRVLGRR